MNHDLEERLGQHLTYDAPTDYDPDQLAVVRKVARRRSMRTRVAAGVFGLAAVAGLGSLVPTNSESNALITATEPTPNETVQEQATAVPALLQEDEAERENEESAEPAARPLGFEVASDGQGGFVAIRTRTSRGRASFIRSTDGENWFTAETATDLPEGFRVNRLRRVDDHFVLELDGDNGGIAMYQRPHLAISTDLVTWQIIDLGLNADDSDDGDLVHFSIGNIAINGDAVAAAVLEIHDVDYGHYGLTARDVCSLVEEQGSMTLSMCDSTLLPIEHVGLGLSVVQRILVSQRGEPASDLPGFTPTSIDPRGSWWFNTTLLPEDDTFVVVGRDVDPELLLEPETFDLFNSASDLVVVAAAATEDENLTLLRADGDLLPVLTSPTGQTVGSIPGDILQLVDTDQPRVVIENGPAGWAIVIMGDGWEPTRIERNGWEFYGFPGSATAELRPIGGNGRIWYSAEYRTTPPDIQMSVFGEMRYLHPLTGELLIELSADEGPLAPTPIAAVRSAVFDRTVEVDGWTIGGNPLLGPLTLTSPTGTTTEFRDGFAFDNDDISDGVESEIGNTATFGDYALRRTGMIRFYDESGTEIVAVRGRQLFDELVVPVLATQNSQGRLFLDSPTISPQQSTALLHSSNGLDWDLVWSYAAGDLDKGVYISNLIVGDDELLAAIPAEILRLPIDE